MAEHLGPVRVVGLEIDLVNPKLTITVDDRHAPGDGKPDNRTRAVDCLARDRDPGARKVSREIKRVGIGPERMGDITSIDDSTARVDQRTRRIGGIAHEDGGYSIE